MPFKRFKNRDIFHNTINTYPKYDIHIYNNKVYWAPKQGLTGVPSGHISLHELNVGRDGEKFKKIYPFITKEGARTAFKTISTGDFGDSSQFQFGDEITGSYPMSASVSRVFVPAGQMLAPFTFDNLNEDQYTPAHANKRYIRALQNTLNDNVFYSHHYAFSADSLPNVNSSVTWNKGTQAVNLFCIPSIFYGSRIKPGSVNLNFYSSGKIIGQVSDSRANGELVETVGSNIGAVAGVVLYQHGIMVLTGSWNITSEASHKESFEGASAGAKFPKWLYYGVGAPHVGVPVTTTGITKSSFRVEFEGTNKIPTTTLMAHTEKAEDNYTINPTFIDRLRPSKPSLTTDSYSESQGYIKNIVGSPYTNHTASFERQVYISAIGIYDDDHNLIGIAKLATPVKKTEDLNYTFKLKMDY